MSLTIETLAAKVMALEARVDALAAAKPAAATTNGKTGGAVADDADLDSNYGDPAVRYPLKEKYWKEQPDPNVGRKFSECPPDYLLATARYLEACAYMARKNATPETQADAEKKAGYKERDASRARGWAKRNAANGVVATEDEAADFENGADPEIPFIVDMTLTDRWDRP